MILTVLNDKRPEDFLPPKGWRPSSNPNNSLEYDMQVLWERTRTGLQYRDDNRVCYSVIAPLSILAGEVNRYIEILLSRTGSDWKAGEVKMLLDPEN